MNRTVEIYFDDLNEDAKERLTETFKTTQEHENWDIFPLSVIERKIENEY